MNVLYSAPGSGLGHLHRAVALCLELQYRGVKTQIVTNSPFAPALARLARVPITGIATERWRDDVRACAASLRPDLLICDTFPHGMRGEWRQGFPAPAVYLARRLNDAAVAQTIPAPLRSDSFVLTIILEPLSAAHHAVIGRPLLELPGPIRLAPGAIPAPVPPALDRLLDSGRAALVIHSGPPPELEQLISTAQGRGPLAVVSPWSAFDYYPATNLIERAAHIVTAAGYNAMADALPYCSRHTAIPFPRTFDDQHARLASWRNLPSTSGNPQAAAAIVDILQSL
ncbi:MAG: hypothetical protein SFV54_25450 [Bryobacteraceae bacterium]|nr:hypothetical protein [Bryobacteraceae bacterium]